MKRDRTFAAAWRAAFARRWSIAGRLTRLYFLCTALLLAVSSAFLYFGLSRSLVAQDRALVSSKLRVLRVLLRDNGNAPELLRNEIEHEAGEAGSLVYFLRVIDGDGRTLVETPGMAAAVPAAAFPVPKAGVDQMGPEERETGDGRAFLMASARAATGEAVPSLRVVQVALDVSHNAELLGRYRLNLVITFLAGSVFAALIGAWVARAGLRPVVRIAHAAHQVTANRLAARLSSTQWPAELTLLAQEFDGMLDRLEDSFRRLSQFTGDMAHALRNPINNLRGEAEVVLARARTPEEYQQALASSLEEYERLSRMIDGLLFIARADDANAAVERRHFEVRAEMEAVREFYDALAAEKGVTVTCEGEATLVADSMLVRRAISNLLANALKHTPAGGTIALAARSFVAGEVEIVVADTGTGIPPEHVGRVFERFYQVDKTRDHPAKGAGLGLAIVQSIMRLHRGTAEIASTPGRGTRATLRFPTASS
ncbi:MAG: heavy metal sensor histidine kinase [Opitutae bacterium]|nr:heavy metal sensor histidine kinase [Opitutae bacterium]